MTPFLLIAPFFLVFGVFGLFPLLYTMWMSLHRWQLLNGDQGFVGAANYLELLGDPFFYNALANTISILVIATVPQLFLALGIAALLNRPLRGRTFVAGGRCCCPTWCRSPRSHWSSRQFFGRDYGLVNWLARSIVGMTRSTGRPDAWSAHIGVATMVDVALGRLQRAAVSGGDAVRSPGAVGGRGT